MWPFLVHMLMRQVCCAWDMYITMAGSDRETVSEVDIPSVYVTMADGRALLEAGEIDVKVRFTTKF